MKKLLFIFLAALFLTGCGSKNNIQDKEYVREETGNTTTAENTTSSAKDDESKEATKAPVKENGSNGNDRFAYKINGEIMDFDSVNGPYIIFNIKDMTVLDCSNKSVKVVDYKYEGTMLTFTLYSDEHPVNETYTIDTAVKELGKLPVS